MADKYVEGQKKIIRKQLKKMLPGYCIFLLLSLVIFLMFFFGATPPPWMWKSDEITIVDIQYRSRARTLSRYPSPGYEITDQDGNLYWSGNELSWEELGETYTIKYYKRGSYRRLQAVSQEKNVIIDEKEAIALWKRDCPIYIMVQLASLIYIFRMLRGIQQELQHPDVQACKERIRAREAKIYRR